MTPVAAEPVVPAVPASSTSGQTWRIDSVWEAPPSKHVAMRGGPLPADLQARFASSLMIPLHPGRPTIIANFVSTLDGVVALDRVGATSGRAISGGFEPDRFLMGLLRATADAIVIGAGTVRGSRTHDWTPGRIHPPSASAYADWRKRLQLVSPEPVTIIVSASGELEPALVAGRDAAARVVVVTTTAGARRLMTLPASDRLEIVPLTDGPRIPTSSLLGYLAARQFALVLSEGGPTLFAELLAARAVDELFLTIAPQVAGRSAAAERLALVEGVGFPPELAPWARLRSVLRSEDHLFLRYHFAPTDREGVA